MHFVFVFELLLSCINASNTALIHFCSNEDGIVFNRQVVPRKAMASSLQFAYCCSPLVVRVVRGEVGHCDWLVTVIYSSCFLSSPKFSLTAFSLTYPDSNCFYRLLFFSVFIHFLPVIHLCSNDDILGSKR